MPKVTELAGDFRVRTGSQLSWLPDQSHSFTQQMFTKHLFVPGIGLRSGDRAVNKIDAMSTLILLRRRTTNGKINTCELFYQVVVSAPWSGLFLPSDPESIKDANPFSWAEAPYLLHLQKLLTQVSLIRKSHLCQGNLNFSAPSLVNWIKNKSTDSVVWNDVNKTTISLLLPQLLWLPWRGELNISRALSTKWP